MREKYRKFILAVLIAGITGAGSTARASAIGIGSATSFTNVTSFGSFGTGSVSWNDGNTVQGVYITNSLTNATYANPLPASTGANSTASFYNLGLSGSSDRALGAMVGNSFGAAYTGFQYKNQTGQNSLDLNYSLVLEQWQARNTVQQTITLAYKITSGGDTNNLNSTGWITLGTALTPLATGLVDALNGNNYQFTISGSTNIVISVNQYVTFRVTKTNDSGADAMVGIDSFTLEAVPEPTTAGLFATAGSVRDSSHPAAKKGLRVATCSHSFHVFVPVLLSDIAKSSGIENHIQIGTSVIGGSQVIEHWDVPDEKKKEKRFSQAFDMRPLLREGKVDVLTLSPIWFPDPGLEKFGELACAHNPDVRIMVNEFWIPNDVYEPVYPLQTKKIVDHNAATIPELKKQQDLYCQDMQKYLTGLNEKLEKNVFFMVPVGHAVIALREKITAGQAPGLSTQEELFKDSWGHPQMPIRILAAYCFYACIYQKSPVGLPPVEQWRQNPELVRLLQELAWDAVTHHPLTGLTAQ